MDRNAVAQLRCGVTEDQREGARAFLARRWADVLGSGHASFVTEHHFTGIGQLSATLTFLSFS